MREAKDPRIMSADAAGGERSKTRVTDTKIDEPNTAQQERDSTALPKTPSTLDAPPSDSFEIDPGDST